ncbi:MAG: flagellar motor protein MotB [Clostridia bacterium]|nr:flagellar motor protein MotB [Clostridia bacterium]MDD4571251.1 flagellar motor protein MotB [Clostridia bacterium]
MRKRKKRDYPKGSNWLETYADMVTLLLTFFVMLFSMSSVDAGKWKVLVEAFAANSQITQELDLSQLEGQAKQELPDPEDLAAAAANANVEKVTEFNQLYNYLQKYIEENNLQGSVQIHKGDGYNFLTFTNNIFFDGNSAVLRPEGKEVLNFLCGAIKNIPNQIEEIRFFGHTAKDSVVVTAETQTFNRQLSMDRAGNVLLFVQLKGVIDPKKLVAEGYGSYRPIVPHDDTEATRIKNRRVEIYISEDGTDTKSLDVIYDDIKAQTAPKE